MLYSPTNTDTVGPAQQSTPWLQVHNWRVYFDGSNDPVAFIERVQEIYDAQNIPLDALLPHMPDLLQGDAALSYRNNRREWKTWTQFVTDFRSFYFSINYAEDLELEISNRRQQTGETSGSYITDLQTLIRRHGGIGPEDELKWLYRNLLPEYRQQICRSDFVDRTTFSRVVRETELLFRDLRPTDESQSLAFPKPRNLPVSRRLAEHHVNRPSRPDSHVVYRSSRPVTEIPATGRPYSRPGPSRTQRPDVPSARQPIGRNPVCWRCGETGHFRTAYQNAAKLFCSRCGKEGVLSRDCCCRPEN